MYDYNYGFVDFQLFYTFHTCNSTFINLLELLQSFKCNHNEFRKQIYLLMFMGGKST